MKKTKIIFIWSLLLGLSAITHTFDFPDRCWFLYDDGAKFPSSDEEFFEKLQELRCPELGYRIPGYLSKNMEERRFLVYWEWRGGIAGSVVGVCKAVKQQVISIDPGIAPVIHYSDHECSFDKLTHSVERFDTDRRNK